LEAIDCAMEEKVILFFVFATPPSRARGTTG